MSDGSLSQDEIDALIAGKSIKKDLKVEPDAAPADDANPETPDVANETEIEAANP